MSNDQPPTASWRGVVWGTVSEYTHLVHLCGFLCFVVALSFTTAVLLHTNGVTIGWIAAAEASAGESLEITQWWALTSWAIQAVTAVASLLAYLQHR